MENNYNTIIAFFARFIAPSVRAYKVRTMLSVLLLFVATGLFICAMEISRMVIQSIQGTLDHGWLFSMLPGLGDMRPSVVLGIVGMACLFAFSVAGLASYLRDLCFEEIALLLTADLRKQAFGHLLRARMTPYRAFESSVLVKRVITDIANVRMILVEAIMLRSADAALFLGLVLYMASLNGLLTLASLLLIGVYFVAAELLARMIGPGLYRSDVSAETMTGHLNQAFRRMPDIKSNQREDDEQAQFAVLVEQDYHVRKSTIKTLMLDRSVTGWMSSVLPIAVTLIGGFQVFAGNMRLDEVLVFVAAINMLTHSVDRLTQIPMIISRSHVSVVNVQELFALPLEQQTTALAPAPDQPLIQAQQFRRRLSDTHALHIDELQIAAGEKVAIIGPSGCGKSSLFASLLRFDESYDGSLKLGGAEIQDGGVSQLRRMMSYMHQHSMVLPGSLSDNVTYSRAATTAPANDPAIVQLLTTVELDDLLDSQDGTRDTSRLSGGQQRRLCLARALYRNAPLLLLDEPLTGVSPLASSNITRHLMTRPEALMMVTHHYEDLHLFDRVILLMAVETADGRVTTIEADGTHAALMQSSARYREVVNHG
jgi:ABC-type multidrug transport system fused ATPase/permease subunit